MKLSLPHKCLAASMTASLVATMPASAQWSVSLVHPVSSNGYSVASGGSGSTVIVGAVSDGLWLRAVAWRPAEAVVVDLGPAVATTSTAFACDGDQQVGYAAIGEQDHASLWHGTASSWVDLNPSGAFISQALGVANGVQVGNVCMGDSIFRACLWRGSPESIVDLSPPDCRDSYALATNGEQQVGGAEFNWTYRAVMWSGTAESVVDLDPGCENSYASAISGDRQGGTYFAGTDGHACIWSGTAASMIDLHPAVATYSEVRGMCEGFQVGVVIIDGSYHACVWRGSAATWTDLHPLRFEGMDQTFAQATWRDESFVYVAGAGQGPVTSDFTALLWKLPLQSAGCSADIGQTGGHLGADGVVDNNDFIAFIDLFFAMAPAADVGGSGGTAGADGRFDNNDFIVFINQFFAGC